MQEARETSEKPYPRSQPLHVSPYFIGSEAAITVPRRCFLRFNSANAVSLPDVPTATTVPSNKHA